MLQCVAKCRGAAMRTILCTLTLNTTLNSCMVCETLNTFTVPATLQTFTVPCSIGKYRPQTFSAPVVGSKNRI